MKIPVVLGIYLREELRFSTSCPAKKYSRFLDEIERKTEALINGVENIDDDECNSQPALDRLLSTLYDRVGLDRLESNGHRVARWDNETIEVSITSNQLSL